MIFSVARPTIVWCKHFAHRKGRKSKPVFLHREDFNFLITGSKTIFLSFAEIETLERNPLIRHKNEKKH